VLVRKAKASPDLLALLDLYEPRIRREFLRIIREIEDDLTLNALAEAIEAGGVAALVNEVGQRVGQINETILDAFTQSARETAASVRSATGAAFAFDRTGRDAVDRMRRSSLSLIREFTEQQRSATRAALVQGITIGENPRAMARRFRASIGLTEYQMRVVGAFEQALRDDPRQALSRQLRDRRFDRTIGRAAREDIPLTDEQIGRMVERYRERWLKHRSETIGRTEALRSVHEGHEAVLHQATGAGVVDASMVVREWIARLDGRTRDTHRAMNGQNRGLGEAFVSPSGARLAYPGDPDAPASETINCRCVVSTSILPRDEALALLAPNLAS
jgi:hypothetical protein